MSNHNQIWIEKSKRLFTELRETLGDDLEAEQILYQLWKLLSKDVIESCSDPEIIHNKFEEIYAACSNTF